MIFLLYIMLVIWGNVKPRRLLLWPVPRAIKSEGLCDSFTFHAVRGVNIGSDKNNK